MVKSTGDGLKRGHIGGMVFRVVNGKQVIQEMPSSYRDRKSEKQLRQRSGMKNIVNTREWQSGDALRVIKIFLRQRFDDGTVGTIMEMEDIYCRPGIDYEMNISDPNLIAVACIHKRLTGSKWKCSTQRLILL